MGLIWKKKNEEERKKKRRNGRRALTSTGLLMEGVMAGLARARQPGTPARPYALALIG